MEQYKQEFIEFMVESNVLTFGDFITKSGRRTPFFINTGNYKTGNQLNKLAKFYAKAIYDNFGDDFDILFGPAYKGIPLSVSVAMALDNIYGINAAYCSNRKEVKDHGDKGILLGAKLEEGDRVIIVEDVTTAGTSVYETMPILKSQAEVDVKGIIISVDRMERGKGDKSALTELKEKFGFKTCSIVTMEEVVEYLYKKNINGKVIIDDKMKDRINEYYKEYGVK
ncbi:orotate phosphoribosyltransferase [Clostridium acetobutylicum]|uniref:Orotate phosphoribosyltransferase n=1 Tax=Clostridium acetobutylicum (strain ATCC 824 / DSM 792 / JCM 1419 / IAM 19013 / LMG 5710 / NBRC 13948 / NRRL B-527 / VKM B-1787 / 2291 / W) TaxID=272562 RepID=PYRE_CLOAB|nr:MULTISPECIES: orotate phosphoribosyltransferase [Clostridium]Q97N11.1 RecName: Full=Orotate phosphoribosyltransferase; Short=OPRT; Short=OPRTase [Clostridium acetobutylicum ATCC 824]AAK78014.1 Orotate phosphoribosyltranspherase [Clostridium acetobutylicum ATCC 824]ADZ19070.1 orotate phosphoribosyltransferase [Clostridium acetobutylicum EA 2018]AEI33045.1 orotate phosphoribosyltransferase [Clostridium acetobutylicum DSM 1731]AWV81923.1 orotate phosphoribosyltransferase [Clostridium acetobuty